VKLFFINRCVGIKINKTKEVIKDIFINLEPVGFFMLFNFAIYGAIYGAKLLICGAKCSKIMRNKGQLYV